jgi:hypothetical protein
MASSKPNGVSTLSPLSTPSPEPSPLYDDEVITTKDGLPPVRRHPGWRPTLVTSRRRDFDEFGPVVDVGVFDGLRQNWYKGQSQRLACLGQGAPPAVYAAISSSCSSTRRAR